MGIGKNLALECERRWALRDIPAVVLFLFIYFASHSGVYGVWHPHLAIIAFLKFNMRWAIAN